MSDLSRWLPFKSRRKVEEPKTEAAASRNVHEAAGAQALARMFPTNMQQLMQHMFDDPFFSDPFSRLGSIDRWFGDFSPTRFQPSIDVVDEESALRVTAELPGMGKDDIHLSIDNDVLTIHGEKKNEEQQNEQGVFRTERYYGYVQRAVPLPRGLEVDKVEANFKDGVLSVRLPKSKAKPEVSTRIPIRS